MRGSVVMILSVLGGLAATAANGQQTAPANAPYVAPTGKTVPRPSDLPNGESVGRDPSDRSDVDRKADKITRGICNGC